VTADLLRVRFGDEICDAVLACTPAKDLTFVGNVKDCMNKIPELGRIPQLVKMAEWLSDLRLMLANGIPVQWSQLMVQGFTTWVRTAISRVTGPVGPKVLRAFEEFFTNAMFDDGQPFFDPKLTVEDFYKEADTQLREKRACLFFKYQ
jgi:hypothetical protein